MDSEICLTCLDKPKKSHKLNEILLENLKILELLYQLVPLLLEQPEFLLPDRICAICVEKLLISYKFKQQCLDSAKSWHKLWSKSRSTKESSHKMAQPKLKIEEVEMENEEEEHFIESVVGIKEDLQMSFQDMTMDSLAINKEELPLEQTVKDSLVEDDPILETPLEPITNISQENDKNVPEGKGNKLNEELENQESW